MEQLRLTCRQAAKFPLPVVVVDTFLAWLLWREGMPQWAAAWLLMRYAMQAATTWRFRVLERRLQGSAEPPTTWSAEQRVLVLLFGLMGLSRAVLVPVLFSGPPTESQYIFTMVCMGLAAAGVGNVGGQTRVYMAFALPLGAALALGWVLQGGVAPVMVGLLTGVALAFLVSFVHEQGRSLRQIYSLVEEREQLAVRLHQEHQLAEMALAARSRFIASASHDLRQPVTTIGLLVGLLAADARGEPAKAMFSSVTQAVSALENLLRGLLDLSRLESGTVTPALGVLSVGALYANLAPHSEHVARAKGLRLRWRGHALHVQSDPVMLQQILQNLIDNALRHTVQGGVLVSARRRGARLVQLEVRDTGVGIALEHQQLVFDEFWQLGHDRRDGRLGLGLGLAIVKRNAGLLGHRLTLASQPGRGSCFSIELPHADAAATAASSSIGPWAPPQTHAAPDTGAQRPLQGLLLWVLDDDHALRMALAARLVAWGARVEQFGQLAALQTALGSGAAPPHGLLTDHRLPDGNGLQAIDAVRARHGRLPALVLTGDTGPAELQRFKAREVPVLHKPFQQQHLLDHLATWMPADPTGPSAAAVGP